VGFSSLRTIEQNSRAARPDEGVWIRALDGSLVPSSARNGILRAAVGAATIVEQLGRRLHPAHVIELGIEPARLSRYVSQYSGFVRCRPRHSKPHRKAISAHSPAHYSHNRPVCVDE
jgi:hypothetical protein